MSGLEFGANDPEGASGLERLGMGELIYAPLSEDADLKANHSEPGAIADMLAHAVTVFEEDFQSGHFDVETMPLIRQYIDELEHLAHIQSARAALHAQRVAEVKQAKEEASRAVAEARGERDAATVEVFTQSRADEDARRDLAKERRRVRERLEQERNEHRLRMEQLEREEYAASEQILSEARCEQIKREADAEKARAELRIQRKTERLEAKRARREARAARRDVRANAKETRAAQREAYREARLAGKLEMRRRRQELFWGFLAGRKDPAPTVPTPAPTPAPAPAGAAAQAPADPAAPTGRPDAKEGC